MELEKEGAYLKDLELSDGFGGGEQVFGKNIVLPKLANLDNSISVSVELCMSKLELFSKEMKVMLTQIEIISEWIHGKFGIDIFDRDRQSISLHHHKKNHDLDILDVGEIKKCAQSLTSKVHSGPGPGPGNKPNSSSNSNESCHSIEIDIEKAKLTDTETDGKTEKTTSPIIADTDDNKSESAETSVSADSETDVKDEVTSECEEFDLSSDPAKNDGDVHFRTKTKTTTTPMTLPPPTSKANSPTHPTSHQNSETKLVDPGQGPSLVPVPVPVPAPGQPSTSDLGLVVYPNVIYSKSKPKTNDDKVKVLLQVQCDECGKILKSSAGLKEHKKTHLNVRPFKCDTCGKEFLRRSKLEMHSRIHLGDAGKNLQCRFCGKLFMIPRDLGRHERTHTGDKPYSCPLCSKSFNVKQHVTLHIRTHTGDKPYLCTICNKKFTQANSLRIHKKIHEGKPYVPPSVLRKAEEKKSNKKKSKPVLKV